MGQAFTAFFEAVQMFFSALTNLASTANNLSEWSNESSKVFVDEARHKRAELIKKQATEAAATAALPPAP